MNTVTLAPQRPQLDCIAFVNVAGETLLTRERFTGTERIRAEVKALEEKHGAAVYALRSYCNRDGKEVAVEILTPAVLAMEGSANRARVEFWRPVTPLPLLPKFTAGQKVDKATYECVGVLVTPEKDAVNVAYDYTESGIRRWNPSSVPGSSPSCHTGDIFVVVSPTNPTPTAYVVTDGFPPVDFTE